MATTTLFQNMLNQYLANDLLKEEMIERDYVLNRVEKDDNWVGDGTNDSQLIVPFKAGGASSVANGQLTAATDIAQDTYVRGKISAQPEVWGSMLFNQKDLYQHGKISEQNFLKILPDTIEDFLDYMKSVVSTSLLNGPSISNMSVAGITTDQFVTVGRPDRFMLGQKVIVDDGVNAITRYIIAIDINAQKLTLSLTRGGAAANNGQNYAIGTGVYNDGFNPQSAFPVFSSMKLALLSAANGGTTQLYGVTKTLYPYTQAIQINGATATADNLVKMCFDGFTRTRRLGKGRPNEIIMSLQNLGFVMSIVEASKGAYNVVPDSKKASQYGWTEISIGSVTNQALKFIGVNEMDDDYIMFIDWRGWKFYSNGFFRKRKSPDGIEYYEVRNQTGYQYIVDISLFGDIVCLRPSYQGVMYGINIPVPVTG
jgi:hypothetical protein